MVHGCPSSQLTVTPPAHSPSVQPSPSVHASPSSHGFVLFSCTHPSAGSHESSVHLLPSSHVSALPTHMPATHSSFSVQKSPSSQALPSTSVTSLHSPPTVSTRSHGLSVSQVPASEDSPNGDPPSSFVVPPGSASSAHPVAIIAASRPKKLAHLIIHALMIHLLWLRVALGSTNGTSTASTSAF